MKVEEQLPCDPVLVDITVTTAGGLGFVDV